MRYSNQVDALLTQLRSLAAELPAGKTLRIMNVCGGHERVISKQALRSLLPENIELIPGPGCPVCVCPETDIQAAIDLARDPDITLLCYGDMLRVPANLPVSKLRTLEQARAAGADVRVIASPLDVIRIAQEIQKEDQNRQLVFFAIGFETTAAPTAAMLASLADMPALRNVSVLLAARQTWPAVRMLLDTGQPGFDALIAPGHVATIMGAAQWAFCCDYGIPVAVAGFDVHYILRAIIAVAEQVHKGEIQLQNCYPEAVSDEGNRFAQQLMQQVFRIDAGQWRGIGEIPASAYELADAYRHYDARVRFREQLSALHTGRAGMPAGCECAAVVLGQKYPDQCALYGKGCSPEQPMGPCMVSDEGACRIWWANKTVSTESGLNALV